MTFQLRPFQEQGIAPIFAKKRGGILWDAGLGKTAGASTIGARAKCRRWLILCPDNAFSVWGCNPNYKDLTIKDWILKQWPDAQIEVEPIWGSPWERERLWNDHRPLMGPNDILIQVCTPDTFIRDWAVKVGTAKKKKVVLKSRPNYLVPDIIIFDEAKRIRNKDTMTFQTLNRYLSYYNVQYFIPMTGTPGHLPKDFWTMLHCIAPKLFGSYWQFVNTFHEVIDNGFGKEIAGARNLDAWHKVLGQHFSVIKEDDEGIAEQRPPLTRQLLPITMDDDQKKLYDELHKELMYYVEQDDKLIIAQNEFTLGTRLRQALICPRILSPSLGIGAAIKDFAETADPEQHNVIFTPFTSAFEHFECFLSSKGFQVQTLQGGIGTPERDSRLLLFQRGGGVCICSILYAQAFSLEPATKAFFIGYDWDPDNNRQAEKRLHRLTTLTPIACYYYTFRSTFDEKLAYIVNIKAENMNLTIPSNLRKLLYD